MNYSTKLIAKTFAGLLLLGLSASCNVEDGVDGINGTDGTNGENGTDGANGEDGENFSPDLIEFKSHSKTLAYFDIKPGFGNVSIYPILSSEDVLENTPDFVYGSMADGCGLLKNTDGTYSLINNIEADYSIARITLDQTFKPVAGEYIVNETATASTAMCSGSLITPAEHGFGPLYLSGGEWGGNSKGVFAVDPYRDASEASTAEILTSLGQWSTENAVTIGKDAFADKTIVFIGDDQSDNTTPRGQLGMYVGDRGDLYNGNLYGLSITNDGVVYEMDMIEGQSYDVEFIEFSERTLDEMDAEAESKGMMGFSRVEDIDWRKGNPENQREVYFNVTGRKTDDLIGKGSVYGRVYRLIMDENNPLKGSLTCVLDGDNLEGKANMFLSPDNIVATENYLYIQEDPNGYLDTPEKTHWSQLYQYNLITKELKTVLEVDQETASADGIGNNTSSWEITGMIDISDVIGVDKTFIMCTQNHRWEPDGVIFSDPTAVIDVAASRAEGSQLYVVQGLDR